MSWHVHRMRSLSDSLGAGYEVFVRIVLIISWVRWRGLRNGLSAWLIPHLLPICAMHSITPCRCKWWWPEGNLETNRFHQDWLFVWSSDCPRSKLRTHLRALTWSGSRRTQPCEAPALQGMLQPQWYSEGSYVLAKLQRMLACYSWCLYSQASQNCPDKFNKSTAYIFAQ